MSLSDLERRLVFPAGICILLIISLFCSPVFAAPSDTGDLTAVKQAVQAMCNKRVVLLGEASHGDGHSDSVKSALVERLVTQCGFNTVLFEASTYEFTPVLRAQRAGRTVSSDQIAAAVGGLWKFDREVQPLFRFMAHNMNSGHVTVGGLDFQPGRFQQPYSNDVMIRELTSDLGENRRRFCQSVFSALVLGADLPEGVSRQDLPARLATCTANIRATAKNTPNSDTARELRNLDGWLAASTSGLQHFGIARDAMMARNAIDFIDGSGKKAKVVIWTHNVHAARSGTMFRDYQDNETLGAALARRYGSQVFALGITARQGTYRWSGPENRPLPPIPATALEALIPFQPPGCPVFIDHQALQHAGSAPAAFMSHTYQTAEWDKAYDGALVLDSEYPPHSTGPR